MTITKKTGGNKIAAKKAAVRKLAVAKKAAGKKGAAKKAAASQLAAAASCVIIIPPAGTFTKAPPVGMAAVAGGVAVGQPASLKDVLQTRHQQLLAFAASAVAAGGMAVAQGAVMGAAAAAGRPAGKPKGLQVLDAVGALIVDRKKMDSSALEAAPGVTVIQNFLIPLEKPVKLGSKSKAAAANLNTWHLASINVAAARAKGLTGQGILVGVLDTGIDPKHPEFKGKKVYFAEFDANGNRMTTKAKDFGTHGTHVSGLLAGKNVGVAPAADLAVAAVLTFPTPQGLSGYFAQILGGMNWLLTQNFAGNANNPGVDLMNASLGGGGYNNYYYQTLASARLTTGTLLAAAIGNAGPAKNQHGSPGNYNNVVGVGALDLNNDVASFSDWGTVKQHGNLAKPDISAPGDNVLSSVPNGGYQYMSGTSMASPVVGGALALLLQQNPNLGMNAAGLEAALYALTTQLSGATNKKKGGRGRLDLTNI